MTVYHVDGELVDRADATVSVDDRGFRYGDAAFETCRAYGGKIFRWGPHDRRLRVTCETLEMADAVPDDLRERVDETLAANDLADAYVRISVTRGVQPGTLSPRSEVDPTIVVYVDGLPRGGVDGDPVWVRPATVRTVETRRIPDAALPADAKTHNYLNGVLARLELRGASGDADEALMTDMDGYLAEGTTSNVFFVDDGVLKTPETGAILPGITRDTVLELAAAAEIKTETGRYRPAALRDASEAFLTNTTWEVRPIDHINDEPIGGGPVTDRIRRAYAERVENSCYQNL